MALRIIQNEVRNRVIAARAWSRNVFGKENRRRIVAEVRDAWQTITFCVPRRSRRVLIEDVIESHYARELTADDLIKRELRAAKVLTLPCDNYFRHSFGQLFKERSFQSVTDISWSKNLHDLFKEAKIERHQEFDFSASFTAMFAEPQEFSANYLHRRSSEPSYLHIYADSKVSRTPDDDDTNTFPIVSYRGILKSRSTTGVDDTTPMKKVSFTTMDTTWHFEQLPYERELVMPDSEYDSEEEQDDEYNGFDVEDVLDKFMMKFNSRNTSVCYTISSLPDVDV